MSTMASQITSLTIDYSTVYSDTDQRIQQSSASLAFVGEFTGDLWIQSPHKGPVTRQMFPFDDVIMGLVQERRNSSSLAMELHLSCINPSIWICRFTTIGIPMMKIKRSWHHVFLIIGIPIPGNKVHISKRGPAAYYLILGVDHVEKT